jgi:hypothetical protein
MILTVISGFYLKYIALCVDESQILHEAGGSQNRLPGVILGFPISITRS